MKKILTATIATVVAALAGMVAPSHADVSVVRLAKQYGIGYLPLTIMEERHLLEKHAAAMGLTVKTEWLRFSAGSGMNDALLSDNLDIAAGGVAPMLTLWARTRTNLQVKGIAALSSMPLYLVTVNPKINSLADFGPGDKIALPGIKTSIQAVTLQMAAGKQFGPGQEARLDPLTVSMGHPDAQLAMLGGRSGISAHFSSPPFQNLALREANVKKVVDSYDVLGGRHTFTVVWAGNKFVQANPTVMKAFMAALSESEEFIKKNPADAAKIWASTEKTGLSEEDTTKLIMDPSFEWTMTPERILPYLTFMHGAGLVKESTKDWRDLFFPYVHDRSGS